MFDKILKGAGEAADKLTKATKDLADQAGDLAGDALDSAKDITAKAAESTAEAVESLKETASDVSDAVYIVDSEQLSELSIGKIEKLEIKGPRGTITLTIPEEDNDNG